MSISPGSITVNGGKKRFDVEGLLHDKASDAGCRLAFYSEQSVRKTRIISLSDVSGRAHFFLVAKYAG